jgi:pilus assembly protein CpaE
VHEQAARLILGTLRSRFDVVVVDAGACVSEASMVAVELSDEVYVVATPDVTGLRGVRRLTGLWERLSARKEDQVGVILNRVHRRNDIQPDTAQRIVGLPVLPVHLQADFRGLEPAINRRDPALADPRYTADVRRLAAAARLARPLSPEAAARRRTRRGPAKRRDAGQSTLELAGLFGLILLVILLLWQGVLLGVTWTLGGHAASEAARALAVGADPQRAAEESLPFTWADTVEVTVTGQDRVSVLLPTPILFPGTQRAAFPVRVSAGTVSER